MNLLRYVGNKDGDTEENHEEKFSSHIILLGAKAGERVLRERKKCTVANAMRMASHYCYLI